MSDSLPILRRQISSTEDLRSVVKTMKAMSAASIAQFERAVAALVDYQGTVERALSVCAGRAMDRPRSRRKAKTAGIIVLGTDQGMAGQFNEHVVEAAVARLSVESSGARVWVVGERAQARMENAGHPAARVLAAPQGVEAIASLVSTLLLEVEQAHTAGEIGDVDICHNVPVLRSNYETRWTRLLPLDDSWRENLADSPWPTKFLPEMLNAGEAAWQTLVSEFLFVTCYRAVAESCAAENGARLASMQRAERNIDERRRDLDMRYNHQRQSGIDDELFDLISGFEALRHSRLENEPSER
jgi:F-type H+-transporting ATPase subunit gamma